MKSNKYALLNKNQTQAEIYKNDDLYEQAPRDQRDIEDVPYTPLQELPQYRREPMKTQIQPSNYQHIHYESQYQPQIGNSFKPHPNQSEIKSAQSTVKSQLPPRKTEEPQEQPQYPQSMVYKIPSHLQKNSVITMQSNFMEVRKNAPFVPPVTVICIHCECKQHIPGDVPQFYCGKCRQLNDIEPKFGFFYCGVCRQKVCYAFKTSDHIQCNICYSINIVPTEPPPSKTGYSKVKIEALNESQMILPKDLREENHEQMRSQQVTTVQGQRNNCDQ